MTAEPDATPVDARVLVRAELARKRHELASLRTQRDTMNDAIRARQADVDTLASVVAMFDRRAGVEAKAAEPVRRARSTT